jgi:hypothetical protein
MKKSIISVLLISFSIGFISSTNLVVNNYYDLADAVIISTVDTVYIDGIIVTGGEIYIRRNIVFIGINNAVLDGNRTHRIFYIDYMTEKTIFHNLTFRNGYASDIIMQVPAVPFPVAAIL